MEYWRVLRTNMKNGLFIMLYKQDDLALYLKNEVYGFLIKPLKKDRPTAQSSYFKVLADYACSRQGTEVFFFLDRKIVYGGEIIGSEDEASFYLNGDTSPIGRNCNAKLFWDESSRYTKTNESGVFIVNGSEKSQPFILKFKTNEHTGKYIVSDDLYFELGNYSYPLPSNTVQGMGFCTLTPGETNVCYELLKQSNKVTDFSDANNLTTQEVATLFRSNIINAKDFVSESELEFNIVANLKSISKCVDLEKNDYVICRQVPISPFKPMNIDRADICLYDTNNLILNGTIPNVVIELKKDIANYHAYEQVAIYLKWLEKVINDEETFAKINAFIIARGFNIKKNKVDLTYENKIKMYSIETESFYKLE